VTEYAHIAPPPPPPMNPGPVVAYAAPAALPPRRSRRRGWVIAAGAFMVCALVFGAVLLGRGSTPGPASALAAAASRTEAQKTARVEMTMVLPIGGSTQPINVTGGVDFANSVTRLQMDMSSLIPTGSVAPTDVTIEMVSKGLVIYMKSPTFDALTKKGAWVKLDYGAVVAKQSGVDLNSYMSQQGRDPSQMLKTLKDKAKSIVEVGNEDVRGITTTHYTVTFDVAEMYRSSGAVVDDQKLAELVKQMNGGVVTEDVWIGIDQYVRKIVMTTPTATGDVHFQMELFDFGAPVDATVPADGDTIDLTTTLLGK